MNYIIGSLLKISLLNIILEFFPLFVQHCILLYYIIRTNKEKYWLLLFLLSLSSSLVFLFIFLSIFISNGWVVAIIALHSLWLCWPTRYYKREAYYIWTGICMLKKKYKIDIIHNSEAWQIERNKEYCQKNILKKLSKKWFL